MIQAIEFIEKSNAGLEPELLRMQDARKLMAEYARAQKMLAFGLAALARRIDDEAQVATVTGTSIGKAKETVATGKVLAESDELSIALQQGRVSLDQASEIAKAEASAPGVARELIRVAKKESFNVLKEKARAAKLDAEQHRGLGERQHAARSARTYSDALGMININLLLEPHVGTRIVARAQAETQRLARQVNREDRESFERYLADAYAALLSGAGKGRPRRPELVVLVSHEVAKRGWKDVEKAEVCKIPGIGPVSPQVAKTIAQDAFLSGVFYDGKDLRHFKRWTRSIPVEVGIALELGSAPGFDGVACIDCGNRFHNEFDHLEPYAAGGPTSNGNMKPRCWNCHQAKTKRERAGPI